MFNICGLTFILHMCSIFASFPKINVSTISKTSRNPKQNLNTPCACFYFIFPDMFHWTSPGRLFCGYKLCYTYICSQHELSFATRSVLTRQPEAHQQWVGLCLAIIREENMSYLQFTLLALFCRLHWTITGPLPKTYNEEAQVFVFAFCVQAIYLGKMLWAHTQNIETPTNRPIRLSIWVRSMPFKGKQAAHKYVLSVKRKRGGIGVVICMSKLYGKLVSTQITRHYLGPSEITEWDPT